MTSSLVEKPRENYFSLRILDRFMEGHKGFICGGCFKNLFNGEKIKDIDTFFYNSTDFYQAVTYFKSNKDYVLYYENSNVVAFMHVETKTVVELCKKIFGSPEFILNHFDFTITKFAYFKKQEVVNGEIETHYAALVHKDFFEHLHQKRLVVDDAIPYPMSTYERMFRYAKYGYQPCRETKLRVALAIRLLPDSDIVLGKSLYNGID